MYNTNMFRFALLLTLALLGGLARAGVTPVDMDTAAQLYQEAAIREQVRASLGSMPGQIRKLFQGNTSTPLTDSQLQAVNLAATRRGFERKVNVQAPEDHRSDDPSAGRGRRFRIGETLSL